MCCAVGRGAVVSSTRCEDLPVCLDGDRLVFVSAFTVLLETGGGEYRIAFTEGYSWDGATIPKLLWSLMGHPLHKELRLASRNSCFSGWPIIDHHNRGIVAPSQL